jgi:hypothetical protein
MTKDYIEDWILSHDCYECFHDTYSDESEAELYDALVQIGLCGLLKAPIYGTVVRPVNDNGCVLVKFKFGKVVNLAYHEMHNLEIL